MSVSLVYVGYINEEPISIKPDAIGAALAINKRLETHTTSGSVRWVIQAWDIHADVVLDHTYAEGRKVELVDLRRLAELVSASVHRRPASRGVYPPSVGDDHQ